MSESEGTVGFQRAFLAWSARTVLVSLWAVSDSASSVLIDEFFRQRLEVGVSKAEALRRAQLLVRSRSEWSNPCFWAAFPLAGGN
jgi:CHAT domain-containing protein